MKNIYFILILLFLSTFTYSQNPYPGTPTVTYAGKIYNTVQIGSQCWLKENLNVGTRINGSINQTNNNIIEKYCYQDDTANCTLYGGLYQWAEAVQYQNGATNTTSPNPAFSGNVQGICPTGWHMPTNAEFATLSNSTAVGGDGNKLKAVSQGTGSGAGTNTSGFSALLASCLIDNYSFVGLGEQTFFWSSMEYYAADAYDLYLEFYDSRIPFVDDRYKEWGFSVRCVQDEATDINDHSNNTLPKSFDLLQNFPNPFNPNTVISYSLPLSSNVRLIVYNSLGQTVKVLENGFKNAGNYSIIFNAAELASGTYFYKIEAGQFTQIKKMILLK
jgi:uncharacterized protein (TIGR02145 family)